MKGAERKLASLESKVLDGGEIPKKEKHQLVIGTEADLAALKERLGKKYMLTPEEVDKNFHFLLIIIGDENKLDLEESNE